MLNRRKILGLGIILTLILGCCIGIYVWEGGYYLPYKPCRPISYPDGKVVVNEFSYATDEPLNKLLSFYNQRLNAKSALEADVGVWSREELHPTIYLFSCYGVDLNRYTTETGCIYIVNQKEEKKRMVIAKLYWGEGADPQCPRQKSFVQSEISSQ